jgi:hypothetical protein
MKRGGLSGTGSAANYCRCMTNNTRWWVPERDRTLRDHEQAARSLLPLRHLPSGDRQRFRRARPAAAPGVALADSGPTDLRSSPIASRGLRASCGALITLEYGGSEEIAHQFDASMRRAGWCPPITASKGVSAGCISRGISRRTARKSDGDGIGLVVPGQGPPAASMAATAASAPRTAFTANRLPFSALYWCQKAFRFSRYSWPRSSGACTLA